MSTEEQKPGAIEEPEDESFIKDIVGELEEIEAKEPEGEKEETKEEEAEKPEQDEGEQDPKPVDEIQQLKAEIEELRKATQLAKEPQPKAEAKEQAKWAPRFKATAEMVDQFVTDPSKAAEVLDNLYLSALQDMAQVVVPYIEERLQPIQTQYSQTQVDQLTNQFLARHKDMEPYLDEARQIANGIISEQNKRYNSVDEFFDDVAKETKAIVTKWEQKLGKKAEGPKEAPASGSRPSAGRRHTADEDELEVIKSVLGA